MKKQVKKSNKDNKQDLKIEDTREMFKEYMERKNWSKRTHKGYLLYLDIFIKYLIKQGKSIFIRDISSKVIYEYQNYLYYYKDEKDKKNSINTQIKKLIVLKTFFNFLQQKNVIIINPTRDIEMPKSEKKLSRRALKETEIERIFQEIDHTTLIEYRDRVILELLYATGIRSAELLELKVSDINFEESLLFVNQGKGNIDRKVPICKIVLEYLKEYIEKVRPKLIKGGRYCKRKSLSIMDDIDYLFIKQDGKRLGSSLGLINIVKKYCSKAGIKGDIGPHNFRVTCATHMMLNGAEERYVQDMLGHRDLKTTEHYLKIEISDLKKEHSVKHPRERQGE